MDTEFHERALCGPISADEKALFESGENGGRREISEVSVRRRTEGVLKWCFPGGGCRKFG